MEKTTNHHPYSSSSLGFGTLLFLVFLILKLTGKRPVANWSWWWVSSPLWIPFVLVFVLIIIAATIR